MIRQSQQGRPNQFVRICLVFILISFISLGGASLTLAQTQLSRASISIDASKPIGKISPLLYGQFIEHMFEGVKFGLDAELLRNRSFEEPPNVIGLSRYWERYPDDRNDDYALNFTWDTTTSYPETRVDKEIAGHSLAVDAGDGVIPRHGCFQSRVSVHAGVDYVGYVWLKTADYNGRMAVALEQDRLGGTVYSQSPITPVKGSWRKYEFHLSSRVTDSLARFVILFEGRGRIWVDQVSLMPADSLDGVRQDVFRKVKDLRPAFLRWPGGNVAQDYHWQWAVGPRDERTAWTNPSWKNELEPSHFGTAEFARLSRNVGAEPAITINVEGRGATVDEAAAWVEYCNGPTSTKYGALRAVHGYPQPFNVKLWEVGNEIWGSWVRGHSDAETYAQNFTRYAAAMRKVDPTIKLIAVGDNNMDWNRKVVASAGAHIDYLAIHHYYGRKEMDGDLTNLMARPLFYEKLYEMVSRLLKQISPEHEIKLAINEWGLDLPLDQQYSMLSALYGGRLMNVFERSDGFVAMSAVSDLVNGWPGGIIQSSREGLFVSPIYLVNQLYAQSLGAERLLSEVRSGIFDSSREGRSVPYLDVGASRSSDRKHIFVKAVNTNLDHELVTTITVKGAIVRSRVEVATVNGDGLDVANGFATPDAIRVERSFVSPGPTFVVNLPAHSVSVLTLTIDYPFTRP
jgi:alpha-L-arabinofuranosidase